MSIHKKLMLTMMTSLLLLSVMSIFGVQTFQVSAQDSASLTGNISDSGVDTDGDGAFNYLEVGVEVIVTEAGDYEISIYRLQGAGQWQYVYVESSETAHLDIGVHVIDVSLYGPTIYVSGVNPANVSYIRLYRINDYHYYLGSLYDVSLSREYSYTEFDSPFADAEVSFIVYPDGRVVMAGALDYTDITPQYTGPVTHGVMAFSKSDDLTSASMDCTFTIPPEILSEIPFDSIDFTLSSDRSNDFLDTEIDCSVVLSEVIASQFPFNTTTDFTATGEYDGNLLTGTITLHMLSGFALGDLDVSFEGNRTDLSFSGSTSVIYGTYYDFVLDETSLDGLIQDINKIKGQGPESLYTMTNGILECPMLDITKTPYNTIGATIDFEATIHGDFVEALAYLLTISTGEYLPETFELLYSALNATYSSVESVSFELGYAHIPKEISMSLWLVEEATVSLPETVSPEIAELIEALLETRYCSVKSVDLSFSYDDGEGNLEASVVIEGDFNAELNYVKGILLKYLTVPVVSSQPASWQGQFINQTEIDVSDFTVSFNLAETSYAGDFGEFVVFPPLDKETATSFQLTSFFNLTADAEFPGEGERLKVTIVGGSNSTHAVTLSRPETVPEPTRIWENIMMVWDNQTLSDLKDLIFNIESEAGARAYIDPERVSAEDPFIVDAKETAAVLLSITEISEPVTIIVENVTDLPEDVDPPPGTFKVLGNCVKITASETDLVVNATIRIYYTPEQLEAAGLDEDTLEIHYWDATLGQWVSVESHVNTAEHYVWAIINHFSIWAIMGQPLSPPIWTQLWFWAVIGGVIVIVMVIAVYVAKRRKPPSLPLEKASGKSEIT